MLGLAGIGLPLFGFPRRVRLCPKAGFGFGHDFFAFLTTKTAIKSLWHRLLRKFSMTQPSKRQTLLQLGFCVWAISAAAWRLPIL